MQIDTNTLIASVEGYFKQVVSDFEILGQGMCNSVYSFKLKDKKFCLKVERPDKETKEQNDIIVEAKVIQLLNKKDPTLEIPIVSMIDTQNRFYVYEFFDGKLLEKSFYTLDEGSLPRLFRNFGILHVRQAMVSKEEAISLDLLIDEKGTLYYYNYPFVGGEIENLPSDWSDDWRKCIKKAYGIYTSKLDQKYIQFIHNDAHEGNILINQNQDFCLIDFGDAMFGDIHSDFVSYIHSYPDYWQYVVDGYEEKSSMKLSRERLVSVALFRHLKGLIKIWNNNGDREHVNEKMDYYKSLLDTFTQ